MTGVVSSFAVVSAPDSPECVVKAVGEIDLATAPQLRDVLTAELAAAPETLVVDMAEVTFIDSTGLSAVIAAFKQGQAGSIPVVLRAPSRRVRMVLEVSGLDKVLTVVTDPPAKNEVAAPAVP
jgi:anti-anti-sigma factor